MESYFTKQVTISGTDYTIKVFTDIYNPIDAGGSILIGVYAADGTPILTDPSKLTTNNSGVSTLMYGGANPTLAVSLYKQVYSLSALAYLDVLVSQNIKDTTQAYYQCNTLADGVVSVFAISTLLTMDDGSAGPGNLDSNTTYQIQIDFNLLNGISPVSSDNVISIDFITANASATQEVIHDYSTICANPLFTMNNLEFLDDIRNSFVNDNPFDYKFAPVVKNDSGQYTAMIDSNNNDVILQFDIGLIMQDLYIKQYLSEYTDYFSLLDAELLSNPRMSKDLLNQTKIALFTKSNLVNSFAKGTLKGIETVFGLFCKNIGQYTFRVEPSPLNSNFIYRITSDMPKVYWTSVIKDIIHPLSWVDEYIQIDNGASQLPTSSSSYTDPADVIYDSYVVNTRDYANKYRTMIDGLRSKPIFYMDVDMNPMYNGDTRYYELAMIENMTSNLRFNFKPNEYDVQLNYIDSGLQTELANAENFVYNNGFDIMRETILVDMDFAMKGIALQYGYDISSNGTVFDSLLSYSPRYKGKLPIEMAGQDITITVTLINDSFSTTVSNTVTLPAS